jgi:uncharacterized repeat protein (TIGR01451 family)
MKTRILLSTLLLVALLTSLALPAIAQGPAVDVVEPAPEKAPPEGKGLPEYPGLPHQPGIAGVATDYVWGQTLGTYTEVTGGTQLTTSCDDTNYNANPIPFTFTFDGADYTQFSLNCNGFIAMGATVSSSYTPISSGTSNNVIVALGGDQQTNTTNSEIRYETLGTSPDQVLVIQWKNFRHFGATGDLYNYQIRLYETSNLVEVVYGPFTQNATARTAQVGLRGASSADFNNRSGTGDWTASVAGTLNSATMALTTAFVPPSGLTWDWSIPVAPNLSQSTKAAPAKVVFGQPIEYTIEILNTGLAPAAGATLVDPIPVGTVYNNDVACSSGQCWYDSGTVYWAGQVATPPKALEAPRVGRPQAGQPAANLTVPASGGTASPSAHPEDVLWDQPTSMVQGGFSDDFPPEGFGVFSADDFQNAEPWLIETIFVPGWLYYGNMYDAAALHWCIYPDAGGLPAGHPYSGGEFWCGSLAPSDPAVTIGGSYAGDLTLDVVAAWGAPLAVPAGTWWLTLYPEFPSLSTDLWYWFFGDTANLSNAALVDPMNYFGGGWTSWTPWTSLGVTYWDLGFRLEGTAGEQPPENPVTVTFSVTPENPECGMVVVNEAVIDDPELPAPVVVQASTEVWQMVLLHEDFEGDVFPPLGWAETHEITGTLWTDQDLEPRGNLTGGAGKFAIVDDDYHGSAALTHAELWTAPFDVPADPGFVTQLLFKTDYNNISANESADVDISLDNGGTWTNLLHWNSDHRGPLTQSVDLTPFAGATGAIVRFVYDDGGSYAWWWEIDDVQVVSCYVAAPEIDVSPLELSQTLCPDATAAQTLTICNLGDAPLTWEMSEIEPLKGAKAPTDLGFAQDIGYVSDNFVNFPLNDFTGQTVVGLNTNAYYGIDFDPTATVLYALNDTTDQLGTIDLVTGAFTGLVSCPPGGGAANWTGLAIDPVSGVFYGSTATQLFTIDPATGVSTLVGTYGVTTMIAIAVNGEGLMYGHDITNDSIYQVDPATGVATLVGPTGYAANYAQGMDFDNQDGTLYIWLYIGSGANVYGTVDLATGAVTPIAVDSPLGEFEGATQTTAGPPPDLTWLSEDPLEGTVAPGTCQDVLVTFDSTGLAPGTYTGWLRIQSNDADEGQIDVPVTLTVEECGADTMHIGDLTGNLAMDPYGRIVARWYVLTHDAQHAALGLVAVDAAITDPLGGPYFRTRLTKPSGWARFHWGRNAGGTFQLCVDNLTLAGFTYVPANNDVPICLPLP